MNPFPINKKPKKPGQTCEQRFTGQWPGVLAPAVHPQQCYSDSDHDSSRASDSDNASDGRSLELPVIPAVPTRTCTRTPMVPRQRKPALSACQASGLSAGRRSLVLGLSGLTPLPARGW